MPKKKDLTGWTLLPEGMNQSGWVETSKNLTFGRFNTIWRRPDGMKDTYRPSLELGPAKMSKKKAEQILANIIPQWFREHLTSSASLPVNGQSTFGDWLDKVWSLREKTWRPKSRDINRYYFQKIREKLGHHQIQDFDKYDMRDYIQDWLQTLALEGYSRSFIGHLLTYVRAVYDLAVERQAIRVDHGRKIMLPPNIKEVQTPVLGLDELAQITNHFETHGQFRDALMMQMQIHCALRPGELFALRWNDWDPKEPLQLRIDETADPKHGLGPPKTRQSRRIISLPQELVPTLLQWRQWCGNSEPEAFMFSAKNGTHLNRNNYLQRVLQPAAEACGIKATLQMLRRTFPTESLYQGGSPKDIQRQMGHAKADMSMHYAQVIPASVQDQVDTMFHRFRELVQEKRKGQEPVSG